MYHLVLYNISLHPKGTVERIPPHGLYRPLGWSSASDLPDLWHRKAFPFTADVIPDQIGNRRFLLWGKYLPRKTRGRPWPRERVAGAKRLTGWSEAEGFRGRCLPDRDYPF